MYINTCAFTLWAMPLTFTPDYDTEDNLSDLQTPISYHPHNFSQKTSNNDSKYIVYLLGNTFLKVQTKAAWQLSSLHVFLWHPVRIIRFLIFTDLAPRYWSLLKIGLEQHIQRSSHIKTRKRKYMCTSR